MRPQASTAQTVFSDAQAFVGEAPDKGAVEALLTEIASGGQVELQTVAEAYEALYSRLGGES